ncbi:MAG: PEP-CTERM sorting domain-containing protein [Candidatus Omnitrophota bacterium]
MKIMNLVLTALKKIKKGGEIVIMKKLNAIIIMVLMVAGLTLINTGTARAVNALQDGSFEGAYWPLDDWKALYGLPWYRQIGGAETYSGSYSVYNEISMDYSGWPVTEYWTQFEQVLTGVSASEVITLTGFTRPDINAEAQSVEGGIGVVWFNNMGTPTNTTDDIQLGSAITDGIGLAGNGQWNALSVNATAPGSMTNVYGKAFCYVIGQKSDAADALGSTVYFDALSTTGVIPEPSSLILLGTGIIGMLSATRKKKRV